LKRKKDLRVRDDVGSSNIDCDKELSSSFDKSLSSNSLRTFFDLNKKIFVFYKNFEDKKINIYFRCLGNVERFLELFDVTGVAGLRSGTS
jgi:hypothetical protein